jgi:hypothetical protein
MNELWLKHRVVVSRCWSDSHVAIFKADGTGVHDIGELRATFNDSTKSVNIDQSRPIENSIKVLASLIAMETFKDRVPFKTNLPEVPNVTDYEKSISQFITDHSDSGSDSDARSDSGSDARSDSGSLGSYSALYSRLTEIENEI